MFLDEKAWGEPYKPESKPVLPLQADWSLMWLLSFTVMTILFITLSVVAQLAGQEATRDSSTVISMVTAGGALCVLGWIMYVRKKQGHIL